MKPEKPAHPCSSDATHLGGGKCCEGPDKKIVTRPDGTRSCEVPRPEKPAHPCSSDAAHIGGGKCCEPPKQIVPRPDGSKTCQ